jgi:hypothetical protein
MTQRERHASLGLSATVAAPVAAGSSVTLPAPRGSAAESGAGREPSWEELYRSASPAQQQEWLALAGRQGLLYAHQLPAPSNGSRTATDDSRNLRLLSQALAGQVEELPAITVEPITCQDTALDEAQREAVARALATPDLCLIQGLPGTGKSRVVAEIVTQAALRGDRVLLLAPAAAALDHVLELVHDREALCPVRCLGRDERPEQLSAAARAATLPERVRSLRENTLRSAVQARQQAEQRCQRRRQEETVWPRLQALAEEFEGLAVQGDALARERAGVPGEVSHQADAAGTAAEPTAFQKQLDEFTQSHRAQLARLDAALADAAQQQTGKRQELDRLTTEATALRPLAEARQQGHWWAPAYWKAKFQGDVPGRVAELDRQRQTLETALGKLEQDRQTLGQQRADAEQQFQHDRTARVDAEIERRHGDLDRQRGHLERHQSQLRQHWQTLAAGLEAERVPAEMIPAAVQAAHRAWQTQAGADEENCRFATQWAAHLQDGLETLAARLPQVANLVAATTLAPPGGEFFADASGQFDLLVVEEADQFTESDLLRAARRARRWVLLGEPAQASPGRAPAAPGRAVVFHRLWQHLHCDPSHLPYTWQREQGGLCCRLRPVAPEQRQWLERESLADFPEIELRILTQPRVPPALAEVVFPPSLSAPQAKEFIYRELQELAVQARAGCLRWRADADRLTVGLCDCGTAGGAAVALGEGVREVLCPTDDPATPALTCHLEFDSAAGWTRPRAEDWLWSHLHVRDRQRTALLETPHRHTPALAAVLSDGLLATPFRTAGAGSPASPGDLALEFVAVPPLQRRGHDSRSQQGDRRRKEAPRVTGGAGLELDLAATRHGGDRLPADLRLTLPHRGVVNYFEAQTVVRVLEELLAAPESPGRVGVLALYPAQAELIRQLVRRSPKLAAAAATIEVDVPAAFRQREVDVAVVSLTRSHSHRAVPYGDGPAALLLALTRARRRLVVVGDVGTLARRVQWQGALDHLDEAAAATEVRLLSHFLRYVQGQGRHPDAFQLSEGSGA